MNSKYDIKSIGLNEYFPSFLADCQSHLVTWHEADTDIYGRIQTFLLMIAKIEFKTFKCYCCIYPHSTSAHYTVFVDINVGRLCLLLTTIRDRNFYPKSGRKIHMLERELLLLDAPADDLLMIRQEIPYWQHPGEPSHR